MEPRAPLRCLLRGVWVDPLVRGSARTRNLETNFFFLLGFQAIGKVSEENKIKNKRFWPPARTRFFYPIFYWAGSLDGLAGSRDELAPGMDPVCVFPVCMRAVCVCGQLHTSKKRKSARPQPISFEQQFIFFSWKR